MAPQSPNSSKVDPESKSEFILDAGCIVSFHYSVIFSLNPLLAVHVCGNRCLSLDVCYRNAPRES